MKVTIHLGDMRNFVRRRWPNNYFFEPGYRFAYLWDEKSANYTTMMRMVQ
jgi:hypothetical protein